MGLERSKSMKLNSIQQKKSAETDCVQQRVIIPLCTTTVGPHLDNWLFQGTPRRAHHSSERTGDFTFDLSFSSLVSTSAFRQPPASLETSLTVYQVLDKGCSTPFSALSFSPELDPACSLTAGFLPRHHYNFFPYKSASFSLCRST